MADNEDGSEERTEQATAQRRDDFRKSGQIAQSREIGSLLILLAVVFGFYFLSRQVFSELSELFYSSFTDQILVAARQGDILSAMKMAGAKLFIILGPVFLIALVTGIGASVAQVGFIAAWDQIQPDIERINPVSGFTRLFKMRSLVEGFKAVLKIFIISFVCFLVIKNELTFTPQIVQLSLPQTFAYIGKVIFKLIGSIGVLMALLATMDYAYQRWELEKKMRMTKQEVKEEFKQREGDPMIKSRIKRIQRELAQKRMMEKVPKADVVITNPTHIAVALQYDREKMAAPVVIAKGADFVAEKIKEIARKHNIAVVENKPLARTMFKTIKIGHAIPKSLYNAVAEVLAYVYKLKGKIQQVSHSIEQEKEHGRTV